MASTVADYFAAKGISLSATMATTLDEQGVASSGDLKYLKESVFLGLFADEKPIVQAKARAAWDEINSNSTMMISHPPVVQASICSPSPTSTGIASDIESQVQAQKLGNIQSQNFASQSSLAVPAAKVQPGSAKPSGVQGPVVTNGKAVASMWCGIISLVIFGLVFGPIAIVLGVMAKKEILESENNGRKEGGECQATAGLVCGGISLILWLIIAIAYF